MCVILSWLTDKVPYVFYPEKVRVLGCVLFAWYRCVL